MNMCSHVILLLRMSKTPLDLQLLLQTHVPIIIRMVGLLVIWLLLLLSGCVHHLLLLPLLLVGCASTPADHLLLQFSPFSPSDVRVSIVIIVIVYRAYIYLAVLWLDVPRVLLLSDAWVLASGRWGRTLTLTATLLLLTKRVQVCAYV